MGDSVQSEADLAPIAFADSVADVPSAGTFDNPNPSGAHVIPIRDITILREIARGAFGIVSAGKWRGIPIAFKQLRRLSSSAIANFKAEIQRNTQIINEYTVRVYGYTMDGDIYGIVMEPMTASVCERFVDASGAPSATTIPFQTKLGVLIDVAFGMNKLHEAGIVHLDLKSQNVLLNDLGQAKIADFGLSMKSDSRTPDDSLIAGAPLGEHINCGTPTHMAPELFVFYMPNPPTSVDVYAFGIFTWESFVVRGGRPRTDGQLPADVPPAVVELMTACWTANARLRPSMSAVLQTLRDIRAGWTLAVAAAPLQPRVTAPPRLQLWDAINSRPPAVSASSESGGRGGALFMSSEAEEMMISGSSRPSEACPSARLPIASQFQHPDLLQPIVTALSHVDSAISSAIAMEVQRSVAAATLRLAQIQPVQSIVENAQRATSAMSADQAVVAELQSLKGSAVVDAIRRLAPSYFSTLRRLALPTTNLSAVDASVIANELVRHGAPMLEQLVLLGNRFGDCGVAALSSALSAGCALKLLMLHLSNNMISLAGARALVGGLRGTPLLKELYLSSNRLNSYGASALAAALEHCPVLEQLHLVSNNMGPAGFTAIAQSLQWLKRLTHLNLSCNSGGPSGVGALGAVFRANSTPHLVELQAGSNRAGPPATSELMGSLAFTPLLAKLGFGDNDAGSDGARAIANAFHVLPKLIELEVAVNDLSEEDEGAIKTFAAQRPGFDLQL